jgi:lipopolysaccharide/colanic/teichoic acid biosynthesis glycosyltransferase
METKRVFDLVVSVISISLLIPFSVIISVLIILDSGFPVFFIQKRVGRDRKLFDLYKFRTMTVLKGTEKGSFDAGNSSRVTRVGKILRKTKLDELPQLLNVLKGDMSLVGPRPEVEKWTKVYPQKWDRVLSVMPGVTDNASIEFRDEEEMLAESEDPEDTYRNFILPIKLKLYEKYVDNHSLKGDVKILINTVKAVFWD